MHGISDIAIQVRVACAGGLALVWLTLMCGCEGRNAAAGTPAVAANPPAPVTVAVATREDVPIQIEAIGWVEASASVTIKPQVEGQITELHFTEGQHVKAGDVLFKLDSRPFVAALKLAEATLLKDEALARDAASEAKRVADLFAKSMAADRERDQAQAQADAQQAQVQADQAAIENAKLRVEYCTIRSLIEGRAGAKLTDVGNVVKANEGELVVINKIHPIYVTFSVAERHLAAIRRHMEAGTLVVWATIADDTGPPEKGELSFIDNQVDSTTGMIRMKATFANDHYRLWPGRFVNVALTLTTQSGATVVPSPAVQTGPSGQFVFVVQGDQTVQMRSVSVGETVAGKVIITKGVQSGETVVTDGQMRLVPGAKVQIKSERASETRMAKP